MLSKLSFTILFLVNTFLIVSGLNIMETVSDAVGGLVFFFIIIFLVWSVNKVTMYNQKRISSPFSRYYFEYLRNTIVYISHEERLGPNKFFRLASASLSVLGGVIALSVIGYYIATTVVFTWELFLHFLSITLYLVVYPLLYIFLHNLIFRNNISQIREKLLVFFALKFVYIFLYIVTFLTPVGWFFMLWPIYFETKALSKNKEIQVAHQNLA